MGKRVKVVCGPTKVRQSFKDECDINKLMARYNKNGTLPSLIKENPTYADFSKPFDYQESLNMVIKAQETFNALPATLRKRFNHDPKVFLEFCENKDNQEELVKLGLANKKEVAPVEPPKPVI